MFLPRASSRCTGRVRASVMPFTVTGPLRAGEFSVNGRQRGSFCFLRVFFFSRAPGKNNCKVSTAAARRPAAYNNGKSKKEYPRWCVCVCVCVQLSAWCLLWAFIMGLLSSEATRNYIAMPMPPPPPVRKTFFVVDLAFVARCVFDGEKFTIDKFRCTADRK